MSRPYDWAPVADRDPVPGDPYEVRALARRLRRTAQSIKEQTLALQRLCTDEFWDSDAGREFRGTARETATKLDAAYARYDAAAEAVDGYAPALEDAQRTADAALLRAQEADEHRRKAQATVDGFCGPVAAQDPKIAAAQRFADEASADIAQARSEIDRAVMYREEAARHAATAIRIAVEDDRLTDSTMDHVKQWIHENADWISNLANIAGWIATICGTLALMVSWIPVVGQLLGAVLTAIVLAASVLALLCHLALLLSGDGSWVDIALDAVALCTFGLGRAAVGGVRAAAKGLRASSKLTAATDDVVRTLQARGGPVPTGVASALVRGDLRGASEMTGIAPGTLRGILRVAWRDTGKKFDPGGLGTARAVLAAAPRGIRVSPEILRDGFNPLLVGREAMEGSGKLLDRQVWKAGMQGLKDLDLSYPFLEREVAAEVSSARELGHGLESATSAMRQALNTQIGHFYVTTTLGVATDWADKMHKFDRWK